MLRCRVFGVRAEVLGGGGRRRNAPSGVHGQGGGLGLQPHQGRARAGAARAVPVGPRAPAPCAGTPAPLLCTLQLACDVLPVFQCAVRLHAGMRSGWQPNASVLPLLLRDARMCAASSQPVLRDCWRDDGGGLHQGGSG